MDINTLISNFIAALNRQAEASTAMSTAFGPKAHGAAFRALTNANGNANEAARALFDASRAAYDSVVGLYAREGLKQP